MWWHAIKIMKLVKKVLEIKVVLGVCEMIM